MLPFSTVHDFFTDEVDQMENSHIRGDLNRNTSPYNLVCESWQSILVWFRFRATAVCFEVFIIRNWNGCVAVLHSRLERFPWPGLHTDYFRFYTYKNKQSRSRSRKVIIGEENKFKEKRNSKLLAYSSSAYCISISPKCRKIPCLITHFSYRQLGC